MGFKEQNLSSDISVQMYKDWKVKNCQPNYRTVRNNIWGSYELSTKLQNS
jgi:hypothetical protein